VSPSENADRCVAPRGRPGARRAPRLAVLALLPTFLIPALARGQVSVTISGRIVDSATRQGIPTAWIQFVDGARRLGVDATGAFRTTVAPGPHQVVVHALGYESARLRLDVRADTVITLTLQVQPLSLEGIAVHVDRMAMRARAVPWQVRTLSREDLLRSAAATPVDELAGRSLQLFPCRGGECIRRRGGLVVPLVCIDERRAVGGLAELRTYPFASLYLIEVHDRGAMIRAYTTWFMDRVREGTLAIRSTLRTDRPDC
jgi:hypothetical protein